MNAIHEVQMHDSKQDFRFQIKCIDYHQTMKDKSGVRATLKLVYAGSTTIFLRIDVRKYTNSNTKSCKAFLGIKRFVKSWTLFTRVGVKT